MCNEKILLLITESISLNGITVWGQNALKNEAAFILQGGVGTGLKQISVPELL
jgi:hypothetical protein